MGSANSPREIVWIDTVKDPSFVFLRPNDESHYFYWPYEVSSKVIKPDDIEPVKCMENKVKIMISRFHYYALTVWISPTTRNIGGSVHPIAVMMRNFHTPTGIPQGDSKVRVERVAGTEKLPLRERIVYAVARRVFTTKLSFLPPRAKNPQGYSSKFSQALGKGVISQDQLFDRNYISQKIRELIFVGQETQVKDVKEGIAVYDRNNGLTSEAITQYFQF